MVDVKANPEQHRIYIRLDQALTPEEFEGMLSKIQVEAGKLATGWVAAIDMRGMWVSDPYLCNRLKHLQETLLGCGASKIATLLDNDAVHMQLGQAGIKTHSNEITRRFYRQQEWESYLAQA
ncbi:MAG: hypothetical protein ACM3PY_03560 [Omnitrophica WOR_2 bacterium]